MHQLYLQGVGPVSLYSPATISFTLFFIDLSTVLHSHRPQSKKSFYLTESTFLSAAESFNVLYIVLYTVLFG
jgi:hypothetical protein